MSRVWKKELIDTYIEMTRDYQGPLLIDWILDYVQKEARVLELGMGPGKDLIELNKHYRATGSDSSEEFLERFHELHPKADLVQLDAVTMETSERFDCICSNKVLQHLTRKELRISLQSQARCLNSKGVLLHTFWAGTGQEEQEGILFVNYQKEELEELFEEYYEILKIEYYGEEAADDSIVVAVRLREDRKIEE